LRPSIRSGRPAMAGLKRSARRSSIGSTLFLTASFRLDFGQLSR
jgi:hypothetical protein